MKYSLYHNGLADWSKEQFEASHANYLQVGRWFQCAHCGGIMEQGAQHYCGAPWQTRAADIPQEWEPGKYRPSATWDKP